MLWINSLFLQENVFFFEAIMNRRKNWKKLFFTLYVCLFNCTFKSFHFKLKSFSRFFYLTFFIFALQFVQVLHVIIRHGAFQVIGIVTVTLIASIKAMNRIVWNVAMIQFTVAKIDAWVQSMFAMVR